MLRELPLRNEVVANNDVVVIMVENIAAGGSKIDDVLHLRGGVQTRFGTPALREDVHPTRRIIPRVA